MNDRVIEVGSVWKHFKGIHYALIISIAKHTETGESLVVYACFDMKHQINSGIFARPLGMFLSEVDREKYPDVKQKYRFELVKSALSTEKEIINATADMNTMLGGLISELSPKMRPLTDEEIEIYKAGLKKRYEVIENVNSSNTDEN